MESPYYSILIPIYNESKTLKRLLDELYYFYKEGHEIIIINDGSTDNSEQELNSSSFISCINLKKNHGKGFALKKALSVSKNDKIIIYDGDLELKVKDISKLMILSKKNKINSVLGIRSNELKPIKSANHWGNFIFTTFYNFIYMTTNKDILCCAKSFYKNQVPVKMLKSNGFDIDVEISYFLTQNGRGRSIPQILINYNRRSVEVGKKLKTSDGWSILKRIILNRIF